MRITSDGDARVSLSLPLPARTTVTTEEDEPASNVTISDAGAVFTVTDGSTVHVIKPGRKER